MRPQTLLRIGFCLAVSCLAAGGARAQSTAAQLLFTVQPSTTTAQAIISPAVRVTARDSAGQPATSFTGRVTLTITAGTGASGAMLFGNTTVSAVAGVATFPNLAIDDEGVGYMLTARAQGLAGATSAPFDVSPDVRGIELVFTVQPSAAAEEAPIRPAVQLTARESSGRTATRFTGKVTLSITPGTVDSEATLSGTTTVAAVAGVATFSTLSIDNAGDGYILSAASKGLAGTTSAPFDVTGAVAAPPASPPAAANARPAPPPVAPAPVPTPATDEPATAPAPAADETEPAAPAATQRLRAGIRTAASGSTLKLDGRLDEPAWRTVDSIGNLVTVEPEEGGRPAGQTIVKILTSPSELIIGVLCRDPNPRGIVSFSKARDADLEAEDHVLIVLDPFRDGRSGYVFAVNPSGARFDGLVSAKGSDVNSDWDAVWEARTARDARGWSAEIRIPIRSLSYKKGLTAWGFNVQRRVQRLQETSRWSGASQDHEVYQTSLAGVLDNLPDFNFGLGTSVRPALVFDDSRPAPGAARERTGDFSLDVTQKLGPNLLASATVNTDFAETEADARQTNLTRFDLFFPEKRTFFLEGADIFEFGLGLDEEILVPFHSRRIGVVGDEEDLVQIPLVVGGKVNGRVGNTNLAALAVRTDSQDSVEAATMGALRVSQNVLDESTVGVLATYGDPGGETDSWMAGADFTFRTTEFLGDKTLLAGVWGLANGRPDLVGEKYAAGGRIEYPSDRLDVSITYARIGEGFQPSLGFVPRPGQVFEIGVEYGPRPEWSLVRQMFFASQFHVVLGLDHQWESYRWPIRPIDWKFESGDRVRFLMVPTGERLADPFEIADGVIIPVGTFRWIRYNLDVFLADKRKISGLVSTSLGGFYLGTLSTVGLQLAIKPWPVFTLELSGERNQAKMPQGDFTTELYAGRLDFKFTSDFQVSSVLQYDNESRNFGTNTRLRWTFDPLGDLFLVFNHNLLRNDVDRFTFESNQLLVKLQYALRR
ncbi:MAG: DUF5916 domain-containing protein [Gemmatimonadales bacterium]